MTQNARYLTGPGTWTTSPDIYVQRRARQCRTGSQCYGTANEGTVELIYANSSTPNNLQPTEIRRRLGDSSINIVSELTYNDLGQVRAVDGPLGNDNSYTIYDDVGRVLGTISADPDGSGSQPRLAARIEYTDGLVTARESGTTTSTGLSSFVADQREEIEYDAYGRPEIRRHVELGGSGQYSVSQVSYNDLGLVECQARRMNAPSTGTSLPAACTPMTAGSEGPDRIAKNIYDDHGRLIEVHSGVGTTLAQKTREMVYRIGSTQNGQLRFVFDAEGNRTEYHYDTFGRLEETLYPYKSSSGTSNPNDHDSVTYDDAGRVDSFTNRAGETFEFHYDNLGRASWVDVDANNTSGLASTHTRDVYYGYDLMGNMTHARFGSHSGEGITNTYNALGQLLSSANNMDGATRTISYDYDAAGRRDGITHPDNLDIAYNFDVLNRLTSIKRDGVYTLFAFDYDNQGRLTERNGYSDAPNQTYSYDAAGRLATLGIEDTGNTTYDADWSFAYNPAGQVTSETRDNDVFAFGNYFDDNGDPIHLDYTSNGLNQIEAKGGLVRTLLVDHAAALRAKSQMRFGPDATIKDCLSASS